MNSSPDLTHLDADLARLRASRVAHPDHGWLRTLREALGMSMAQLGRRMGLPRQGVLALEQREASGAVSLKTLRQAAAALDAELVYAIVPRTSLRHMLEQQAKRKATEELSLVAEKDVEAALSRRTAEWLLARPRALWDDGAPTVSARRRPGAMLPPPTLATPATAPTPPGPSTTFRPPPDAS